jgi:hypothetical protein
MDETSFVFYRCNISGMDNAQNPTGIRSDYATSGVDVNGDNKIGLPEAIYILQKAAEMR